MTRPDLVILPEDEKYALEALVNAFGGSFSAGEDPPDAYLQNDDGKFAVEVTRLIEPAYRADGSAVPRIAAEAIARKIGDKLVKEFAEHVSSKRSLLMRFSVPIRNSRKLEVELQNNLVKAALSDADVGSHVFIAEEENENGAISIFEHSEFVPADRRIAYYIANRETSADVHDNLMCVIKDRICDKQSKHSNNHSGSEYWLALLSGYWLADERSFYFAYQNADLAHDFDRIYVIRGKNHVHRLF